MCLIERGLVLIQPRVEQGQGLAAIGTCYKEYVMKAERRIKPENRWAAYFDVDEMLVLHHHQCIADFVASFQPYNTSVIMVNWKIFMPPIPNSEFIRTNNPKFLTADHLQVIDYHRPSDTPLQLLPHDREIYYLGESVQARLIKCIVRVICANGQASPHYPSLNSQCPHLINGTANLAIDQDYHIERLYPWTDSKYFDSHDNAQLNHYTALSTADYLRKIKRGSGGDTPIGHRWHSDRMFEPISPDAVRKRKKDISFHNYYGELFKEIKTNCPRCLDTMWFELV